jgi:hypothetical protein
MRRQMEHEIAGKEVFCEVIGRGRGPDHSKGPQCKGPKGQGDRQGVTILVK